MSEYNLEVQLVWNKIRAGDYSRAHTLAKELHTKYHREALAHVRIHFILARINYGKGAYIKSAGNCIAGINFAIPSSLAQKYLGIGFVR